jgi:hypothetical protein
MMHEKSKRRVEAMIRDALPYPGQLDILLDEYADGLLRATEWDADQWNLPTQEIGHALAAHARLGGPFWPREVL